MTQRVELAPGTYPVRNTATGVATNYIVQTLTVAIAQATLTVGQTASLTTNAAPGAAYQWRRGASDIAGATSATYVTQAADSGQSLSCRVTSGAQVVTSAPVTVGAAASFSAAFVAGSYVNNNTLFDPTHSFPNVPIGAADSTRRLYIFFWTFGGEANTLTLSVNGGPGISATAQIRPQGFRQVLLFVADVPTGTTANFVFSTSGTDFQQASMAVVRAVGTHTPATATATPNGTSLDVAINTVAGDTVFVGIMGRQGVANGSFYTPPSGFTEHVDAALKPTDTPNPSAPLFLGSGAAAGGTPQTITATAADFTESAILALRLRAA